MNIMLNLVDKFNDLATKEQIAVYIAGGIVVIGLLLIIALIATRKRNSAVTKLLGVLFLLAGIALVVYVLVRDIINYNSNNGYITIAIGVVLVILLLLLLFKKGNRTSHIATTSNDDYNNFDEEENNYVSSSDVEFNDTKNPLSVLDYRRNDITKSEVYEHGFYTQIEDEQPVTLENGDVAFKVNSTFYGRLCLTTADNKDLYTSLSNYISTFENVNSEIEANAAEYKIEGVKFAEINVKENNLYLYLNVNPYDYANTDFLKGLEVVIVRNKDLACRVTISNSHELELAYDFVNETVRKYS